MTATVGLRPDNQVAPAIQFSVGTRNRFLLGELGVEYLLSEGQFAFNGGVEKYFFKGILRISAGLRIAGLDFEVTPSLGCGVQIGRMNVSYALAYPMSGTIKAGNHLVSVAMKLGP